MALPKRKSQPITIDDDSYRWMVSATPHGLNLTVGHDAGGQLLRTTLKKLNLFRQTSDAHWEFVRQGRSITPSLVRSLMEMALHQGWTPLERISKPFTLNALVWRNENLIDQLESISLDQWLDPPVHELATSDGLLPVANLAQRESERLVHDLAWPCDFRNRVLDLAPGESLPIPTEWLSQVVRDAGLEFAATFQGIEEKSGYPMLLIKCEQYNAVAGFQLMWW